ncbi:cob(I)yrinic acid a,c-diamide adenosyltransferase [Limnobacter humi]|uniref:Cobalamin adenosyltransferase n=1 Tax=Limnobacter humi TaxID=1778671 RepID=A0ABT1WEE2_9BURK|nr:cob(I)yrinic acid a,c-diamide adenosyltransferase [Limnobacter humi]MCQ8895117.1 cob(I)yrinic acid a,c-diamide adenosyltransferase [Limnobacter humi]
MGNRLSSITTRTGDDGTTGLADGSRLSKKDLRVHAMGDVDELNSHLGLLLTEPLPEPLGTEITRIQHDLFDLGAALCMPGFDVFPDTAVARLDTLIAEFNKPLARLEEFILPGGSRAAAYAHIARTVCRRAERVVVDLKSHEDVPEELLLYLNRLSDFLFVAARWIHHQAGVQDVQWKKGFNRPAQA